MAGLEWANRALSHARLIAGASAGRGSATRAEAQAAEYVRRQLNSLGVKNLRVEPFNGLRSIWFFLALVFGLALMGHLARLLFQPAIGAWGAWGISTLIFGFSFYLIWCKFTFKDYPLREVLPHGPSQNVVAVISPQGEERRQVVLTAHLDSHRAVIWFAADALTMIYGIVAPLAIFGVAAAPLLYGVANLTGLSAFNWLGAVVAVIHFLGWFTGVTADLGVFSPGANDNASAVGTVLAIAERLRREPLKNTAVWCVFTGCEETGCDGMRSFLKQHDDALKDALFLNFELVGIGERLVYLQSEGVVRKRRIARPLERLITRLEGAPPIQALGGAGIGMFTETGAVWEHGHQGVCLMALREKSYLLPEWHRMTDTPDKLQLQTMGLVHQYAWALIERIDRS
jgi:hypothetical protein